MKDFNDFQSIKFLIVMGKMNATIMSSVEKHIRELGINTTEFLIMYAIASNGALSIQDIASRIFVTSGNMTYTINKLEKNNFIVRIRDIKDSRKIYINFTEKGNDFWLEVMKKHKKFTKELFSNIDNTLIDETIDNMKLIGKSIKDI